MMTYGKLFYFGKRKKIIKVTKNMILNFPKLHVLIVADYADTVLA